MTGQAGAAKLFGILGALCVQQYSHGPLALEKGGAPAAAVGKSVFLVIPSP
jgi:hypothetical protein